MKERLLKIREEAKTMIEKSSSLKELEELRIKFLGKKGELTNILKGMGKLSKEERPEMGKVSNDVRNFIEKALITKKEISEKAALNAKLDQEVIDVTMPAKKVVVGKKHPLMGVFDELSDIFIGMGYKVAEGPEVETVYNAFDALNSPDDHPSRSMSDTFYFAENICLRPHTSSVQIRTMKTQKPPIKIISPGRCFRFDELDATHSPMFHQLEGLVIDEGVTMADLKGALDQFVKRFFGSNIRTKFRPHHFPFTEPSAEVDVTCFKCGGVGCKVCSGTGWIEILGCGMVHPDVLEECGIDSEKYSGFAFGMGVDRITMLKYEIEDIRYLFENDMRMIKQF